MWTRTACFALMLFGCTETASPPIDPEPPPPVTPPPEKVFEPGPAVLPRLTEKQYRNTLEDLFGTRASRVALEPDTNPYLFYSIGATSTSLSEVGAQGYADAAAAVLDSIAIDQAFIGCAPAAPGDACVEQFLRRFGRRLFRRPLDGEELDRWMSVARDAADGDAVQGIRMALYGMLQSPNFIYRFELGETDPKSAHRRYTSYEMSARLSFLIWNSTPDEALLDAADRDELITDAGLRREATRLLGSPRAREPVQDFFSQYFDLSRLSGVERDAARYPLYSEALITSMRHEVRLLVEDFVFRRNADIRQIFSTRRTFVNSLLAELYQVEAPGASAIAYVPVELPADGPRAGLLTLGAFLAMNAHPTDTSPTLRGKYVRERVLCQTVPAPPENVDTELGEPTEEARTLRERLEQHRRDPTCAGCHSFIDPPGFLFEGFDSIGVHRTEIDGIPLDTSGDLDGVPLADARDLAEQLKENPLVSACVVKQLYRHASGRLDERSEERALIDLEKAFAASGYKFEALMVELVLNQGFRTLEVQP